MSEPNTQPFSFDAVIFDVDGVITKTAVVHAASWKVMFDEYLRLREKRDGEPFKEFTYENDYLIYVDGKPRYKGVQSFLESRGINIKFGNAEDWPDMETVCGLGNRKNATFIKVLKKEGVEAYPSAVDLIRDLKDNGIHVGAASSSKNCRYILQTAKIDDLFETRVDGVVSAQLGLKGKPEGDIFVKAAKNIGALPIRSVVIEDAVSGVQAGVNGGFGLVIGIARENNEEDLKRNGADVVVTDLKGVTTGTIDQWFSQNQNQ
jgi:beta-phosphoglucomutase family hydrolase